MPKPVNNNIPSAGDKKRKEVSVSANESGPPKKKYRYICSAEGCTNQVVKGGVCIRHGAKAKRCSSVGCTNQAQNGGVCIRHGARKKLCSADNCTNKVVNGGVCMTHGAKAKLCSADNCTNYARQRGVCGRLICRDVKGGGIQNNASTVVDISDNEDEGGEKQSPIAGRKRKAGVGKQQSKMSASNANAAGGKPGEFVQEVPVNKDAIVEGQNAESDKSSSGVANLKDDNEQDTSDMRPQKRVRGEGNLKDDREQDVSDVAPVKEGEGGIGDEMEVVDNWGGDGQNEYDCEGDDNGDVNSVEGKHSHVVPEEITAIDNDVEKDSEIQRLTRELKDSNNTVITLKDQLKEISTELEAIKSRSKSEHERTELLRSKLNGVNAQIAELEEELEAETAKKAEMDTQLMTSVKTRLEERVAKDAANAKLRESKNKFDAAKLELNDATSQLKLKSDDVAKLKKEVAELKKVNASLQNQLENQSNVGGIEVKEEELTDDEDFTARLKQRRTERSPEMQS